MTYLCGCGCGLATTLSKQTDTKRGYVKGEPMRFVMGHGTRLKARRKGYRVLYRPDHPRANPYGYVLEHIVIVETVRGKPLPPEAEVHHVDGNTLNNAHSNLVICPSRAYHKLLHLRQRILAAGGDPNTERWCGRCGKFKPFDQFWRFRSGLQRRCKACCREYEQTYERPPRAGEEYR